MRRQRAAESALRRGLEDLQRRLGFDGPIGHLDVDQRRQLSAGQPRPVGPEGFNLDGGTVTLSHGLARPAGCDRGRDQAGRAPARRRRQARR